MFAKKLLPTVAVGILLLCAGGNTSSAQSPGDTPASPGRVYLLHTPAGGGCPELDWHVVVGEQNTLSGLIGLDDNRVVFNVTGTFNSQDKTFQLFGPEIGGTRTAMVTGTVQANGRLTSKLNGLPVGPECQAKTVSVQWISPRND